MGPIVITAGTRPLVRALFAAAVLVFAVVIAPIGALMVACSMPCCGEKSFPFVHSAAGAACAEQCGISSNTASRELPAAVAPSTTTAQVTISALAVAEAADNLAPAPPPRLPAFSAESHHTVPGDAPLYIYNSAFLI